jgi:hypothetical protein
MIGHPARESRGTRAVREIAAATRSCRARLSAANRRHARGSTLHQGIAIAFALGASLIPRAALAFSDSVSFALPPTAAGGGNRYFTGSPADGYTCKVCHSGGPEPALRVLGLPTSGYDAGVSYEVVLDWSDAIDKFSAALEFTDANGGVAGSVRLPPDAELLPAEFCEPASAGVPAASLAAAPNGRQVVSLPDCGAKQLRLLWTAPTADRALGPIWFAGSAVVSNGEGDPSGDGVTDFTRIIGPRASGNPLLSSTGAGCSAMPVKSTAGLWPGLTLLIGSSLVRARRRRAQARPAAQ